MNWSGKYSRRTMHLCTAALGLLAFAAALPAAQQPGQQQPAGRQPSPPPAPSEPSQPPASQAKITTESKLVTVYATVRDKKGTIVNSLTKDDFVLEEDGHAQPITNFARESDLPLTMGLLVDTSMSQRRVLEQERHASYTFLDHMLRDTGDKKDRAFVIHFDHEVELLQDLTSSRQKLEAALESLETPRPQLASQTSGGSSGGGSGHGGGSHHGGGGGTLLYDAVFLGADEVLKKEQGRKALIVLSDGVDRGSQESLDGAVRAAQRANTIVYSILFKDEESHDSHGGYGGGYGGHGGGMGGHRGGQQRYPQEDRPDGKKVLERISKETGGRLFVVSKKETVDEIYSQIEQELRHQYILGYPPQATATGVYHRIHLATKQKDLTVQSRDGYYSEP
jgi:VWFA-related protein